MAKLLPGSGRYEFDLSSETLFVAKAAAKYLAKMCGGKAPHISAVRRWMSPRGARGVVLPSVVVGGTRHTSAAAIAWWIAAASAARENAETAKPVRGAPLSSGDKATLARFGLAEGV